MISPGVSVRKYPCGYVHHGAIDTLLDLLQTLGVSYEDVEEVVVPVTAKQQRHDIPVRSSVIHAKKSFRFLLAVAVRYGKLTQGDFTDEKVQSPEIQEALGKIRITSLSPAEVPERVAPARYQPAVVFA